MLAVLLLISLASGAQTQSQFEALSTRAAQARESDHAEEAVQLYREALQLQKEWAEGLWYLGTLSYDGQQFAEAAAALTRLVAIAPKDANAFAMLGLAEVRLHQNAAALAHLKQALKLGVGDEGNLRQIVSYNQAVLLLNDGEFGQAQAILDQLAQEPHTSEEELVMALGRSVLGMRSSSLTPDMQGIVLAAGQAEILAAHRQTEAARAAYAEMARDYPKVHNVQFAQGRFLLDNHLDDEAVAAFKREIENSPQHLLARLGIAGALLVNDPATALRYAREAAKLAPKLEETHYLLGASLLGTEQPGEAVVELETARRLKDDDSRVYFVLAKAYQRVHRNGDAAEARARFARLRAIQQ